MLIVCHPTLHLFLTFLRIFCDPVVAHVIQGAEETTPRGANLPNHSWRHLYASQKVLVDSSLVAYSNNLSNSLFCWFSYFPILLPFPYAFLFFHLTFYCCPVRVVPVFPPLLSSAQPTPLLPHSIPTLLSMSVGHSYMFLNSSLSLLSTLIPLPRPLWLLAVCSLFPCLWLYFVHLFVLFIRFLL